MTYKKGANRERKLMALLQQEGFIVCRAAGSHGAADLIALRKGEIFLIQVKCTQSKWSGFGPKEREELARDAELAGGVAILAWWPTNKPLSLIYPIDWPKKESMIGELFIQSLIVPENNPIFI